MGKVIGENKDSWIGWFVKFVKLVEMEKGS
jgi:hypothetical protein